MKINIPEVLFIIGIALLVYAGSEYLQYKIKPDQVAIVHIPDTTAMNKIATLEKKVGLLLSENILLTLRIDSIRNEAIRIRKESLNLQRGNYYLIVRNRQEIERLKPVPVDTLAEWYWH